MAKSRTNGVDSSFSLEDSSPATGVVNPTQNFAAYKPRASSSTPKARFTIPMRNGAPDFERMRPDTLEEFRALYANPEIRKTLGIVDAQAKSDTAPPVVFTEQDVKQLYDMLGPVEAYIVALSLKCPVALASKVFTYTEDEKKRLVPVTQALLNKYSAWLGAYAEWKEEINFGFVMFAVTREKLTALRAEITTLRNQGQTICADPTPPPPPTATATVEHVAPVVGEVVDGFTVETPVDAPPDSSGESQAA